MGLSFRLAIGQSPADLPTRQARLDWLTDTLPAVAAHGANLLLLPELFACGYNIGAQVAQPNAEVWAIVGDGGFQMTVQELATAVQENLPIRIGVLNNRYLGMVRQLQQLFCEQRYEATKLLNPDFVRLAEAYGVRGWSASDVREARDAIVQARAHPGPALVEFNVVDVGDDANVYPIVPPGAALDDMIRRPE